MGLGATSSWLLKMNYNVRYITRKIFPNKCTCSYKKSSCIRYNKQPKITLSGWKLRRILKRGTWLFRQRKGKSKQYSQQGHERGLQVCKGISQGLKKKRFQPSSADSLACELALCYFSFALRHSRLRYHRQPLMEKMIETPGIAIHSCSIASLAFILLSFPLSHNAAQYSFRILWFLWVLCWVHGGEQGFGY